MLDLFERKCSVEELYNVELSFRVFKKQTNKRINLIGGDARNLPLKDNVFDYVIIKNLLHHLIGSSRRESKNFAKKAINEMIRVTKDGGYIIILEQYNRRKFFANIIFYLTLFLSSTGLSRFTKNVIVSFLTPDEVRFIVARNEKAKIDIIVDRLNKFKVPIKFKLTFLMSDIGRILLIGAVKKK
ncbi:MAG: class I SAM-dependent methyltransferase [Archaeoglobus sp.]|nr:class I SAM-dependent methyltransferase [Archaeoglobus sp.]